MATALVSKSLTELRGIAQSFGVKDIFTKDQMQLIQAIEMQQKGMLPEPKLDIPKPEYDARLMTKPPAKKLDQVSYDKLLQPYVERGLHFAVDDNGEYWTMSYNKRSDSGTMRMTPNHLLRCAQRVME